jgi:hypothetical protein
MTKANPLNENLILMKTKTLYPLSLLSPEYVKVLTLLH